MYQGGYHVLLDPLSKYTVMSIAWFLWQYGMYNVHMYLSNAHIYLQGYRLILVYTKVR